MEHSASFFSEHQAPWPLHIPVQPHSQQTIPAEGLQTPQLAHQKKVHVSKEASALNGHELNVYPSLDPKLSCKLYLSQTGETNQNRKTGS